MEGLESDNKAEAVSGQLFPPAQTEWKVPADRTVGHGVPPPVLQAQIFRDCGRRHEAAGTQAELGPAAARVRSSAIYQFHAPS